MPPVKVQSLINTIAERYLWNPFQRLMSLGVVAAETSDINTGKI
jgi:hypothetical protein